MFTFMILYGKGSVIIDTTCNTIVVESHIFREKEYVDSLVIYSNHRMDYNVTVNFITHELPKEQIKETVKCTIFYTNYNNINVKIEEYSYNMQKYKEFSIGENIFGIMIISMLLSGFVGIMSGMLIVSLCDIEYMETKEILDACNNV